MLQRFSARLRSLWSLNRQESDLDDEIRFHLSEEADTRVADGLSPDEARRAAQRDVGNVTSIRAATRDVWIWPWLQDAVQDVRFAGHLLVKDRRFTLAAVTVLALAIGANAAVFTIANAVFVRGLPFHEPDRILRLWTINDRGQRRPPRGLDYEHWREARSLSDLVGHSGATINLSDEGRPRNASRGLTSRRTCFALSGRRRCSAAISPTRTTSPAQTP